MIYLKLILFNVNEERYKIGKSGGRKFDKNESIAAFVWRGPNPSYPPWTPFFVWLVFSHSKLQIY
jgi:hypothetical protein